MFDPALLDYPNQNHFFFSPGDSLAEKSKDVPDAPGIYYIIALLADGGVELKYIGKSGTVEQDGSFKNQLLRQRLNNKQDGMKRQEFFEIKMSEEGIVALDIYWYITFDKHNRTLPAYAEAMLLQQYFDTFGQLPPWNKSF